MRGSRNSAGTRLAVAAAILAAASRASAAGDPALERATFRRTEGEITLDGRLDEADWRTATAVTSFFETYPANLGVPAVATTAAFLYDDRNVYVAIRADPDPASIRAPIVRRDQVLQDQDYVEVFLDPLNTRRSAQFFRVNASGIVTDGQYDDKSRLRDYSPDLNFDAATSLDERGWTVEMRIPLSSLRYQAGVEHPWALHRVSEFAASAGCHSRERADSARRDLRSVLGERPRRNLGPQERLAVCHPRSSPSSPTPSPTDLPRSAALATA